MRFAEVERRRDWQHGCTGSMKCCHSKLQDSGREKRVLHLRAALFGRAPGTSRLAGRRLKRLDTSAARSANFTRLPSLTDDATVRTPAKKQSGNVRKRRLEQGCLTNIDVFPCCRCGDATGT
jgi:hypothetical protein